MYVCLCNAFNDKKVEEVIANHPGAKRVKDVYSRCANKQKPQCGKCLLTIKNMMDQAQAPKP